MREIIWVAEHILRYHHPGRVVGGMDHVALPIAVEIAGIEPDVGDARAAVLRVNGAQQHQITGSNIADLHRRVVLLVGRALPDREIIFLVDKPGEARTVEAGVARAGRRYLRRLTTVAIARREAFAAPAVLDAHILQGRRHNRVGAGRGRHTAELARRGGVDRRPGAVIAARGRAPRRKVQPQAVGAAGAGLVELDVD